MTDRELLEAAAKAAGIEVWWNGRTCFVLKTKVATHEWNPLTDDGDALRLAVTLGLVVNCSRPSAGEPFKQHAVWVDEHCDNATLTRRAIVRAAAEIGRQA